MGFSGNSVVKNPPVNAADNRRCGFDPWIGKIYWRKCQPTPVFSLRESMDRGALRATVHGVTESETTEHTVTLWVELSVINTGVMLYSLQITFM